MKSNSSLSVSMADLLLDQFLVLENGSKLKDVWELKMWFVSI
jgi:hypothetical protein